jgi:hypothetical protein
MAVATRGQGRASKPVVPATCRLTLRIADKSYTVRGFPAACYGAGARGFRLRCLETGLTYDIAETPHGPTCDCPDQTFRHEGRDNRGCKHLRALTALGILAGFPAPTPTKRPDIPGVTRVRDEFDD